MRNVGVAGEPRTVETMRLQKFELTAGHHSFLILAINLSSFACFVSFSTLLAILIKTFQHCSIWTMNQFQNRWIGSSCSLCILPYYFDMWWRWISCAFCFASPLLNICTRSNFLFSIQSTRFGIASQLLSLYVYMYAILLYIYYVYGIYIFQVGYPIGYCF